MIFDIQEKEAENERIRAENERLKEKMKAYGLRMS